MTKAISIISLLCWILCSRSMAQSLQLEAVTAEDAAAYLTDPNGGVEILNVTYFGDASQIGKFSNGIAAGIGMDQGIILSTGNREFALLEPGTNLRQIEAPGLHNPYWTIMFRAGGRKAEFDFVFASMEYPGFVNTPYNDYFEFRVTGQGIEGSQNFALIPGTETEVTINNVNGGEGTQNFDGVNEEYFVYNYNPVGEHDIVYFGFTTVIRVTIPTYCDSVYTLRTHIANVGDHNYDSAVFLKKGSLKADYQIGDLTVSPNPVCEGEDITLTVDANPDGELYTYGWSTGQEGVGMNSITVPAVVDQDYSVSIDVNNRTCLFERTVDVAVHPQNNQPPYTTGVNGLGEYTAYFQAGVHNCFTVQTVDNPSELVIINGYDNYPVFMDQPLEDNAPQESATFCWTPGVDDYGEYTFTMEYQDNNACQVEPNSDEITVFVACPYCPLHVEYNNRTPTHDPLPPLTEAGEWIKAGLDEHVAVGNEQVVFRAPHIYLGGQNGQPGSFDSGPNFIAEAEPACLPDECDDCCASFTGFWYETPGDEPTITPDGDYCNDVWYLRDTQHPVGAFGAVGFVLTVYASHNGNVIYRISEDPGYCYSLHAPSTEPAPCPVNEPQPYSDIYWPGIVNQPGYPGYGCYVNDGLYPYTVSFKSPCTGNYSPGLGGSIRVLGSPGPTSCDPVYRVDGSDSTDIDVARNSVETDVVNPSIAFSYSPQNGIATASMIGEGSLQVIELFGMDGRLLYRNDECSATCTIDAQSLSSGVYILRALTTSGQMDSYKFLKQ